MGAIIWGFECRITTKPTLSLQPTSFIVHSIGHQTVGNGVLLYNKPPSPRGLVGVKNQKLIIVHKIMGGTDTPTDRQTDRDTDREIQIEITSQCRPYF
jgi:hypothetical protein